jgi:hypothetical protein
VLVLEITIGRLDMSWMDHICLSICFREYTEAEELYSGVCECILFVTVVHRINIYESFYETVSFMKTWISYEQTCLCSFDKEEALHSVCGDVNIFPWYIQCILTKFINNILSSTHIHKLI